MSIAKDESKRRINFVLDLTKPREKALADFLDHQFSITGTVKEAIEEKMLRSSGQIVEVKVENEVKENLSEESPVTTLAGAEGLMDF